MKIYETIELMGKWRKVRRKALIDTGAEVSIIPLNVAVNIGARKTSRTVNLQGLHGKSKSYPLGIAHISFPKLRVKGEFPVAIGRQEVIIGMNVLSPLGININSKTKQLYVKNEIWEAFKTFSAISTGTFLFIKALDSIFKKDIK